MKFHLWPYKPHLRANLASYDIVLFLFEAQLPFLRKVNLYFFTPIEVSV